MRRATTLLLLAALVLGTSACPRRTPEGLEPCAAELPTLCNKVDPGEGRLLACLRKHDDALTPPCRERVALLTPPTDTTPMGPKSQNACRFDIQAQCREVAPGGGRIKQCLLARAAKVSPPCRAALEMESGTAAH